MHEQDTQTPRKQQDIGSRRLFRALVKERRAFKRGSIEHQWRTKAAAAYLQMMRGVPAKEWKGY